MSRCIRAWLAAGELPALAAFSFAQTGVAEKVPASRQAASTPPHASWRPGSKRPGEAGRGSLRTETPRSGRKAEGRAERRAVAKQRSDMITRGARGRIETKEREDCSEAGRRVAAEARESFVNVYNTDDQQAGTALRRRSVSGRRSVSVYLSSGILPTDGLVVCHSRSRSGAALHAGGGNAAHRSRSAESDPVARFGDFPQPRGDPFR